VFTYVVRRTLAAIPLLLLISIILFEILNNAPGGPLAPYLQNPHITPADIERLKHNLGLIPPPGVPDWLWTIVRYFHWLGTTLHGDFGYSTSNSEPVLQAILERVPATIELMGVSFIVSLVIGLAAGIFSAMKPYSLADYCITTLAFFGQSMPVFWFALMLQLLFSVHGIPLPGGYQIVLPSAGISTTDQFDLGDRIEHLIMPVIVLSLLNLAMFSRFMRGSLLEVMRTDYMRTAAAKGLSNATILFKHGLKNALIPVVTIVAISFPGVLGGAIVTETIFAWPGAGRMFYSALQQSDIALMMGYLLIIAVAVVFSNLLADVLYAWLDPRVTYD
jgi:peptide/nickel transport system permease protein